MIQGKKVAITIQARMSSTRLPGKILKPAVGKPLLELMVERLKMISGVDQIILCTTVNKADDVLVDFARNNGIVCYRGSEHDVMSRVLGAALENSIDVIVETTSDCPLIDPEICGAVLRRFVEADVDYCSNVYERSFPIGMDVQVFSTGVLSDAYGRCSNAEEREHVSLYIYRHPERYKLDWIVAPKELRDPDLRLTLDTEEDYLVISRVFDALYNVDRKFNLACILEWLHDNPETREINSAVKHNWVTY